jgi:Leucine-rich repeat (LRR) protein
MIHTLDLSTNGIVGELPVFKLPHLCELNLDNNHVVGMQNLMVSCLDSLQILTLRNNKLTSLPMLRHRKLKRILL